MRFLVVWMICGCLCLTSTPGFCETNKQPPESVREWPDGGGMTSSDREEVLDMAKRLYTEGKLQESLEQYNCALELLRSTQNDLKEADILSDMAVIYRRLGAFEQSLDYQQQAARLYTELGNAAGQAKALRRIGVLYRHQGKLSLAISYQEDALAILKHEHDENGVAQLLSNIGIVYGELGRLQDAQRYFEEALAIQQHLHNKESVSYILGNLGKLFLYLGDSTQALDYLERSLAIKRELNDVRGEANTLLNTGTTYENLGDFQKALTLYYDALELYRKINEGSGEAAALGSIGSMYETLGDFDQAQQYQQQSLHVKRVSGTPIQVSLALTNLGSLAIKQQRFPDAERYLQEALQIATEQQSILSQANIYGQMGLVNLSLEKFHDALEYFSRSLTLYEELGSQQGILEIVNFIGEAYISQTNFQEAQAYYERALQLARKLNDMNALWTTQYHLGHIHLHQEQDELAFQYFQHSISTLEQMRSYLKVSELRQLFMRKNLNPYHEMIRLLLKKNKPEAALLYLERLKARTFLEMVAHGEPQLHTGPALIQEERYLAARIRILNERLHAQRQKAADMSELRRDLKQAKDEYEHLLLRIKLQYPDYYRLKIVDADEIQQFIREGLALLEENVVILEYFLDETTSYVWIIEHDRISTVSLPIAHNAILERILEFRRELHRYDTLEFWPPLHDLYRWLIAPITPYLEEKQIVGIVPFEILHFVPLAAFISTPPPLEVTEGNEPAAEKKSIPEFFIEQYAVFSLPSFSILPVVRERTQRHADSMTHDMRHSFLGIGATDGLAGAQEEIETVLRYFPDSRGYTGKDATKQRLFDEAGQYDIIHLATHGVFDKQHPIFSRLQFAADTVLYAREVFGLHLWATLVTLSGCETLLPQRVDEKELHELVSGDELVGFIRAFMYAGTPSVLSSLWRVSDVATEQLMSEFYHRLPAKGKVTSLQLACLDVIRTTIQVGRRKKRNIHLLHPFFWSSFVLIGDWK